ncbi:hypothetical protein DSL72_001945 [Monilinia vaccinii-corymbosi]|uniref:Uncharacterized protein n=1 Tax=Monilinia vaccinii-corymbosi TaxID=61207 RepID=A0A8A3PB90_9HELO|nr:hypothetical protein DSL72_001945 [Monilinia vaccinii-corymbosi]
MADELSLPRLTRDNTPSTSAKTNLSRKRVRDTPPPDSSDPPIFSSDDDPSVEKYSQKRRKQRFRGPWFDQQIASDSAIEDEPLDRKIPIRNKRTFSKKVDSGVFMGSDGTDVDDIVMENGKKAWPAEDTASPSLLRSRITLDTPKDIHAQKKIEKCMEDGEEYIDLSRLALDHLENSTIRPLGTFVKAARAYATLEPSLRIILSGNRLTKLPAELFNLNRLVFLSLRDNKLQEIPPSIGKLTILEDLNISQNNLGYLPYEILDLIIGGTLFDFQLHPNPFYVPMAKPESTENSATHFEINLHRKLPVVRNTVNLNEENPTSRSGGGNANFQSSISTDSSQVTFIPNDPSRPIYGEKCTLSYQFRTEVRFLDIFGKCIKGPIFPSDTDWKNNGRSVQLPVARADDIPEPPAVCSRVQSLVEKALQSCSRSPELPHLESYLEFPPLHIPSLLKRADNVSYSGPTLCTVCNRSFIVPRAEWIEWWEIEKVSKKDRLIRTQTASAANQAKRVENERDAAEKLIPLIRRSCSWLCLPQNSEPRLPHPNPEETSDMI